MNILGSRSVQRPSLKPSPGLPSRSSIPPQPAFVQSSASQGRDFPDLNCVPFFKSTSRSDIVDYPQNPHSASKIWDSVLDAILAASDTHPFAEALERALTSALRYSDVVFWQDVPSAQSLISASRNLLVSYGSGLVGYCRSSLSIVRVQSPSRHPSFSSTTDGFLPSVSSVMLLPLVDVNDVPYGVLEFVKTTGVTDDDTAFGQWLSHKLRAVKKFFERPIDVDAMVLELEEFGCSGAFFEHVAAMFQARAFEVWKYAKARKSLMRYTNEGGTQMGFTGLALACLEGGKGLNVVRAQQAPGFHLLVDKPDEPVMCVVVRDGGGTVFGFVLRGSRKLVFTESDEARLAKLAPHVLHRLAARGGRADFPPEVLALAEVAAGIARKLEVDELLRVLIEKCRVVTKADRCSCFIVSDSADRLVSRHQTGARSINIPAKKGIAGYCVREGKIVMEADAYQCPLFDPRVDRKTGFRTRAILAVPVFGGRGDVIGCLELINKEGGGAFSEGDCKIAQLFSLVYGLVVDNSIIYRFATDVSQKMKSIVQATSEAKPSPTALVQQVQGFLKADRAAFYAASDSGFKLAAQIGTFLAEVDAPGMLSRVAAEQKPLLENEFCTTEIDGVSNSQKSALVAVPAVSRGKTVGILIVLGGRPFVSGDAQFLTPFATLCSLAYENSLTTRSEEFESVITDTERNSYGIPESLLLTSDQIVRVRSLNCFAPDFKGSGHFQELFMFFHTFNFFEEFQITAERFYRFLTVLSSRYTATAYHNWTHACDVAQSIFFMCTEGQLSTVFESWEIFTLLTAAVCHDANHPGQNNVYNVKAETPLGILYKDQSVLEIHHVHESIQILTRPDIDLFGSFKHPQLGRVWFLFTNLILATDMGRHFELVKRAQTALSSGNFSHSDPELRLLDQEIIMKVADISNVARPFSLADSWCDILNEEFFHQGDLEKAAGIPFTSPLNDREHSNKPKSQIGFYTFICLPLYSVLAGLHPRLQVLMDQVKSNLEKWKALESGVP